MSAPERIYVPLENAKYHDINPKTMTDPVKYIRHDLHTAAIKELVDELKWWDESFGPNEKSRELIKKYGGE